MAPEKAGVGRWHAGRSTRPSAERLRAAKWSRVALISALILGSLGGLVALALLVLPIARTPNPYFVPLWVGEFQRPRIASIPWMDNDRKAMQADKLLSKGRLEGYTNPTLEVMRTALGELVNRGSREPVVVYVASYAIVDDHGAVRILASDTDPDEPETMLLLGDLLDRLAKCPSESKLLVLDVLRRSDLSGLGGASDAVADRVLDEVEKAKARGLLVLLAGAPGQVALGTEELGQSAFNHFFRKGLAGAAEEQGDGQVTVRELAAYLDRDLDDWAARQWGKRLSPVLSGTGRDFPLVVLRGKKAKAVAPPKTEKDKKEELAYPAWLEGGWKTRDAWWDSGEFDVAPRAFRALDESLLRAEHDWRGGVDAAKVEATLTGRLGELKSLVTEAKKVPLPNPRVSGQIEVFGWSVGAAKASGWKADPALVTALAELLRKRREPEPFATPEQTKVTLAAAAKELQAKLKDKTSLDVAGALVEAVARERFDTETIRFLDQFVRENGVRYDLIELRFLRQLAQRAAATDAGWNEDTAKLAWNVMGLAERANLQPHALRTVRRPLDDADALRHESQVLLLPNAAGFASWDQIATSWNSAYKAYAAVDEMQAKLRRAQLTCGRGKLVVVAGAKYLEPAGRPDLESLWLEIAGATRDLDRQLASTFGKSGDAAAPAEGALDRLSNELSAKTDRLDTLLTSWLRPFRPEPLLALTKRAESEAEAPDPRLAVQIEAALATPFPLAETRKALWSARRTLSRRLDGVALSSLDARPEPPSPVEREQALRSAQIQRAKRSGAIFDLAGLETSDLESAWESLRSAGAEQSASRSAALTRLIAQKTSDLIARQSKPGADAEREAAGWVIPVYALDPNSSPTAERRRREALACCTWLAEHYRHDRHDLGQAGDPFYETAILECSKTAGVRAEAYAETQSDSAKTPSTLYADQPALSLALPVLLHAPESGGALEVESTLLPTADPRLTAAFAGGSSPQPGAASSLVNRVEPQRSEPQTVEVRWREGETRSSARPPAGFIIKARLKGEPRATYTLVPLRIVSEGDRLRLVLSRDPDTLREIPFDLRLRPLPSRQTFSLFVRNPSATARAVVVELRADDTPVPGGTAKVAAAAGTATKVTAFAAPVLKPTDPLPELNGSLVLTLREEASGAVLDQQRLTVDVARPRDYLQVTNVRMVPAGGGDPNRLTIKLRALPQKLADPPCHVELVLPKETIPGLLAPPKDARLSGDLVPEGELELYARDFALDPAAEEGFFTLNVDGSRRALWYRVVFPTVGTPSIPREDTTPRVRFQAEPVVKPDQPAQLLVRFEVDNAPPRATLEWTLKGPAGLDRPPWKAEAKKRHVGFDARGGEGALLFEAGVGDWTQSFNVANIEGPRQLQARVFDETGRVVATYQTTLVLDDLPPQDVKLGALPATPLTKGTPSLPVTATATPPASGIKEVVFFVGKPADFEKAQAAGQAVKGQPRVEDPGTWGARLPLPGMTGTLPLSVRVVSHRELAAFDTGVIEVVEPKPAMPKPGTADAPPPKPGAIRGSIRFGEVKQQMVPVVLTDPKEKTEFARTKTGANGAYEFKDLAPGKYKVISFNEVSRAVGRLDVTVESEKTANGDLELIR